MKYLDLDFIYGLYMYLDLDLDLLVVDLCPSLLLDALTKTIFIHLFLDPHGIEFNHEVLTPIRSKYHELDILLSLIVDGIIIHL